MEIAKFLRLLVRRWYILVAVPLLGLLLTYLFVQDIQTSYRSQAKLAFGLPDQAQPAVTAPATSSQKLQMNQEVNNLVEMMKLKKILAQVSCNLIMHDLSSSRPYRKPDMLLGSLSSSSKKHALKVYKDKYDNQEELNLDDAYQHELYNLLKSMKYDEASLRKQFDINRQSNTDFLCVELSSENPELSAAAANELCRSFLSYYDNVAKENQYKSANFLHDLAQEKLQAMNDQVDSLKAYKINNKILNLDEQSKILYNHLMLVTAQKYEAQKAFIAYNGAISKISGANRQAPLQNKNDPHIVIDSLQKALGSQINNPSDKNIFDLQTNKNFADQKLSLQVQRDIAGNNIRSLSSQLNDLNSRFNRLVPYEAVVQSYEQNIDVATKAYLDVLNKYNQAKMESGFGIKLKQVQTAMSGVVEPSKKTAFLLMAGVISLAFCLLIFLLIALFDNTINNPKQLALKTQQPVLGHLNLLAPTYINNSNLWYSESDEAALVEEKRLMRSLRFEIDQALALGNQKNVLGITSLEPLAGKTFLTINLAYAFAMMKKEVLLIDGNFTNPVITKTLRPSQYIEDILQTGQLNFKSDGLLITVAGNKGEESSLLEVNREEYIRQTFQKLPFDIILIEMEALNTDNKAKEWFVFTSNILSVFEAGQAINYTDEQRIKYLKSTGKFNGWVLNKASENFKAFYPVV
jgi:succinoglycan biosynthesis transport protein ExoP